VGGLRDGRALSPVMGGGGGWVEQGQEGLPAIHCRATKLGKDGSSGQRWTVVGDATYC
jgi:hypothetical protein